MVVHSQARCEASQRQPGFIAVGPVQASPTAVNHPNVWLHQGAGALETGVSRLEGIPQP